MILPLPLITKRPEVWNSRGKALMATGNYTAARDSFDRAIQLAPEYAEAKENRNLTLNEDEVKDPKITISQM